MTATQNPTHDPLERPLIVIGSPRSGTTILGSILSAHPDVCYLDEPRLTWRYGNDRRSDLLRPEHARPEVVRYIRRSFLDEATKAGKTRIVEKTPSNAIRMPFLDAVFPDARYVHILRNGSDAALSIASFWRRFAGGINSPELRTRAWRRVREISPRQWPHYGKEVGKRLLPPALRGLASPPIWGPRLPGIERMARELTTLELACLQWRMSVELACDFGRTLPTDRYREVRLDRLDAEGFSGLLSFAGLSAADEVLGAFDAKFNGREQTPRTAEASAEDRAVIERWTGVTSRWLGFE